MEETNWDFFERFMYFPLPFILISSPSNMARVRELLIALERAEAENLNWAARFGLWSGRASL